MTRTRFPEPRTGHDPGPVTPPGMTPLPDGMGWTVHDRRLALRLLGDQRLGVLDPEAGVAALRAVLPPAEQLLLDDIGGFAGRIMLQSPPERHGRLRHAFGRWFDAPAVERLAPGMRECAHRLLVPFVAAGGGEFMTEVAFRYAMATGAQLLGTSPAGFARLHRLSQQVALVAYASRVPDPAAAVQDGHAALTEAMELLADAERTAPEGSVLAAGPAATGAGAGSTGLTDDEFRANSVMLVQASVETVAGMLGSTAARLLATPGAAADPGARADAVADVLREEPPLKTLERVAREPVEIDGVTVRAGQIVSVRVARANDGADGGPGAVGGSAVFSFGWGAYRCLGARMSRRQADELFDELGRLAPGAACEPDAERVRHVRFDMPRRLPVVVAPAPPAGADPLAAALSEALAEHDLDRPLTSLELEIAAVVLREHGVADPDRRPSTIRGWVTWANERG